MLAIVFTLCIYNATVLSSESINGNPTLPEFRDTLIEMLAKDQKIRDSVARVVNPSDGLIQAVNSIDKSNGEKLKLFVSKFGCPDISMVGRDGVQAFWSLVHHGNDDDFQRSLLPYIKTAFENGIVPGQQYAHFVDKILVHEGKPQKYGTQLRPLHEWIDNRPVAYEMEDPENINARRAKVGLFSFEDYLKISKSIAFSEDEPIFPANGYQQENSDTEIGIEFAITWSGTIDEMRVELIDVIKVKKESSADKAGVQVGDRIIEIDGIVVAKSKMRVLEEAMDKPAGDNISFIVEKPDGSKKNVSIKISAKSSE
jgi:hypothetical protein